MVTKRDDKAPSFPVSDEARRPPSIFKPVGIQGAVFSGFKQRIYLFVLILA
jgi:hypothetical protein